MAIQHLFAFSASVDGAAIAAGSPYGCGAQVRKRCYNGGVDVPKSIGYARWRESTGKIDGLQNLASTPIVLFNGNNDWEVYTQCMRDTRNQLYAFVDRGRIFANFETNAAHVWSLDHGRCSCGKCGWYDASLRCCDVNNCNFDLSGTMLKQFYGSQQLMPRTKAQDRLRWINQLKYIPKEQGSSSNWQRHGMWKWAFLYLPKGCEGSGLNNCRIHVNYHGCINRDDYRRRLWVTSIDINEYAEANNIIVFYPQAAGTERSGVGCWNWAFTQDDPDFDTRDSVQLRTVMNILEDLAVAIQSSTIVNNSDAFDGLTADGGDHSDIQV